MDPERLEIIPRHPEARFIIGGSSPFVHSLDPDFLKTGLVIGLNKWPMLFERMDYWLCCDTDIAMREYPEMVYTITCTKFMQCYDHVPDAPADIWFKKEREYIPTHWEEKLNWTATSACAAINLACLMGACEIYLYGVDLMPGGRADGSFYALTDHWGPYIEAVNNWLTRCQALFGVKIYKMNPASSLNLEYRV